MKSFSRRHLGSLNALIHTLLFMSGATAWGGWSPAAAAPKFAVVPAATSREGQSELSLEVGGFSLEPCFPSSLAAGLPTGHLRGLEHEAEAEGLLDRLFGTNCFSQAVSQLRSDCRRMEQESKTRLALSLMNCQLAVQQARTFPCHKRQSIKECTEALTDRAHALFVEFLTHADRWWCGRARCVCWIPLGTGSGGFHCAARCSAWPMPNQCDPSSCCSMCLHIQNQNFEKYTENMLDRLAEGAGFAKEQLAAVAQRAELLRRDTEELKKGAEAALGLLRQHGELEEVGRVAAWLII